MPYPPETGLTAEQVAVLRARYGPARKHSRTAVAAVVLVSASFLMWVVWAAFAQSSQALHWQTIGFGTVTDSQVVVNFSVDKPSAAKVSCTLQAVDASGAVVGEATVSVNAPQSHVPVSYPLRTLRRPTGVQIQSCVTR